MTSLRFGKLKGHCHLPLHKRLGATSHTSQPSRRHRTRRGRRLRRHVSCGHPISMQYPSQLPRLSGLTVTPAPTELLPAPPSFSQPPTVLSSPLQPLSSPSEPSPLATDATYVDATNRYRQRGSASPWPARAAGTSLRSLAAATSLGRFWRRHGPREWMTSGAPVSREGIARGAGGREGLWAAEASCRFGLCIQGSPG